MNSARTGMFGKLPAHGDFIHRNLSSTVINALDTWLQTFVGSTQERLGEHWLDIYLTSPIWRFCLAPGVVDQQVWAGIMLPSVDRVGRYFPLTLLHPLPAAAAPCEFIATQEPWFSHLEEAALQALDGQINVDTLLELSQQQAPGGADRYRKQRTQPVAAGVIVDLPFDEPGPMGTMPHLLDAFVSAHFASYSIWATAGSERVQPCTFISAGMPPVAGSAAMMDGLWEQWEWSVPVHLTQPEQAMPEPENHIEPSEDTTEIPNRDY